MVLGGVINKVLSREICKVKYTRRKKTNTKIFYVCVQHKDINLVNRQNNIKKKSNPVNINNRTSFSREKRVEEGDKGKVCEGNSEVL